MSVLHSGERFWRQEVGVPSRLDQVAERMVRDRLTSEHQAFFPELPFVVLSARDPAGQPWATLLCGPPGFAYAEDHLHLRLDSWPKRGDALFDALEPGSAVGLLGLQPHTRRRNRENGVVKTRDHKGWTLRLLESFGNCPKYITPRLLRFTPEGPSSRATPNDGTGSEHSPAAFNTEGLSLAMQTLISHADTFFVASGSGQPRRGEGLDVSHRGGSAGFVRLSDEGRRLRWPDYPGNLLFNTLGNIHRDDRVGLCFVDWHAGSLLQLTGTARAYRDELHAGGTDRWVEVKVSRAHWASPVPLRQVSMPADD